MNRTQLAGCLVCAALLTMRGVAGQGQAREARGADAIQSVASMDELKPQTTGELVRARHFKGVVGERLLPGMQRHWMGGEKAMPTPSPAVPEPNLTDDERFFRRVCSSDAVVLGLIESRRTMLTADENSLFTDYQVSVIEAVALVPNATRIIATHGGGEAIVGGQLTRDFVSDDDLPKLQLQKRYLLLLRNIPNFWQDNVYEVVGAGPNGDIFPETEYPRAASIRANCSKSVK